MPDERPESNVPISKELLERINALPWADHEKSQKFRVHDLLERMVGLTLGDHLKDQT